MTQRIIQKFSFSAFALKYDNSNIEFIVLQSAKIGLNRIFKIHIHEEMVNLYSTHTFALIVNSGA